MSETTDADERDRLLNAKLVQAETSGPVKRVTLIYADAGTFSGQKAASEMLGQGLRSRGWATTTINTPALKRSTRQERVISRPGVLHEVLQRLRFIKFGYLLVVAWIRALRSSLFEQDVILANLGQTKLALVRDGFPLFLSGKLKRRRAVVSLHGNVFMYWSNDSSQARLLRGIAAGARYVTVLGPRQRNQLRSLGIPHDKTVVIDNTCTLPPIDEEECARKHAGRGRISVLYFSNLIEAKGYPDFMEALLQLATASSIRVEAVICGQITILGGEKRFGSPSEARDWINRSIAEINSSGAVTLRWIDGATGAEKQRLFREAQVLVLPTRYRVEAQPIVILEGMASGCAIVTSRAGEIPTTVDERSSILLDEPSAGHIVEAIRFLHDNPDARARIASSARSLFLRRFTYQRHIDRWEQVIRSVQGDSRVEEGEGFLYGAE